MIKPPEINETVWKTITAANDGDADAMRRLLAEEPARTREGYFYTPPIYLPFAKGTLRS